MPGKRIAFDEATWQAVDLLARDRMMDFQELADEAFRDLLRKHGRPTDLRTALRRSVDTQDKSDKSSPRPRTSATGKKRPSDRKARAASQ